MTSHPDPAAGKAATPAANARSEGLLPADENDTSLHVAEEVAFDLQSDKARRVGAMPDNAGPASPADAVAASLQQDGSGNGAASKAGNSGDSGGDSGAGNRAGNSGGNKSGPA